MILTQEYIDPRCYNLHNMMRLTGLNYKVLEIMVVPTRNQSYIKQTMKNRYKSRDNKCAIIVMKFKI